MPGTDRTCRKSHPAIAGTNEVSAISPLRERRLRVTRNTYPWRIPALVYLHLISIGFVVQRNLLFFFLLITCLSEIQAHSSRVLLSENGPVKSNTPKNFRKFSVCNWNPSNNNKRTSLSSRERTTNLVRNYRWRGWIGK